MAKEDLKLVEGAEAAVNAFADVTPKVRVEVTAENGIRVSGSPPLAKGDVADIDASSARVLAAEGSVKPATDTE